MRIPFGTGVESHVVSLRPIVLCHYGPQLAQNSWGTQAPETRAPHRGPLQCTRDSAHARVSGVPSACPSPSQQVHPVGNFAKHASHGPSRVGRGGESACGVQVALRGPRSAGRGGAQGRAASGCAWEGRARPKASQQKGDSGDLGRGRGLGSC